MNSMLKRLETRLRSIRYTRQYRAELAALGATFSPDPECAGAELVKIGPLVLSVKSEEDLFILTEVFECKCYNFDITQPTVVIDIGMNIGTASLFFATNPLVEHVYSFEPFPVTFGLAQANIRLNPAYAGKITTHNFGLSNRSGTEELPYIEERKGSVGINGMPNRFTPSRSDLTLQSIELRDAATILPPLLERHPQAKFVMKMDCEGSEYKIFRTLEAAGVLGRFHAIMLEWHVDGPSELRDLLRKHDYAIFCFDDRPSHAGMLYAAHSI